MIGFSKELWMQTWMATEEAKAYLWCQEYKSFVETRRNLNNIMSDTENFQITTFQLTHCSEEDLKRLCIYLGIHPSSDFKRKSMINWLCYMGYVNGKVYL